MCFNCFKDLCESLASGSRLVEVENRVEHEYLRVILHNIAGKYPVSILRKSISGRHRPVTVADGPMTARCRFT